MKYNLIVGKISNCEIVIDLYYGSLPMALQMFEELQDGLEVGYYMHIVTEINGSCELIKEKINPVNIPVRKGNIL